MTTPKSIILHGQRYVLAGPRTTGSGSRAKPSDHLYTFKVGRGFCSFAADKNSKIVDWYDIDQCENCGQAVNENKPVFNIHSMSLTCGHCKHVYDVNDGGTIKSEDKRREEQRKKDMGR